LSRKAGRVEDSEKDKRTSSEKISKRNSPGENNTPGKKKRRFKKENHGKVFQKASRKRKPREDFGDTAGGRRGGSGEGQKKPQLTDVATGEQNA